MSSVFVLPSRFYPILDTDACLAAGLEPLAVLDVWLEAGVRLVQLRAKALAGGAFLALAEAMAPRCRAAGAMFVINDRADIAVMAGVAAVHIGQEDLAPRAVRDIVGPEGVIGLSTHTPAQYAAACREPVDYLAIGPVFSTSTKTSGNAIVGLDGLASAARAAHDVGKPIVAIGGITLASAAAVLAAGADAVAVISDLLVEPLDARVREYLAAAADI